MKKTLKYIACWIVLAVVLAFMYLPLILVVVYSFISSKTVGGQGGFTFSIYASLFKNEALISATVNTLIIGLASAVIATVIGTISAVGIYYMKRGKKIVNFMSQITVVNAEIVTAVGFYLLSLFIIQVLKIPMVRGIGWLILAHTVMTLPYVILSVSPRLAQLNPNLFEAGMDLGASPMRTLITVIAPQLIPGMISGFAISFTLSLDDFVITNLNKDMGIDTISTYVYTSLRHGLPMTVRALSTIIFVAVMVVLIAVNLASARRAKAAAAKM